MPMNTIAFETRISRVLEGLSSDPQLAVSALKRVAALPLVDFFGGDRRRVMRIARPLKGKGIRLASPVGYVAAVLDEAWNREEGEQRDLYQAAIVLAGALANTADGDGEAEWLRQRPSSAPLGAMEGRPPQPVSLSSRIAALEKRRSSALDAVANLGYAAYLEALDTATGDSDMVFTVAELQGRWNVDAAVNVRRIAQVCCEMRDEENTMWLVDAFVVKPLAGLYRLAQAESDAA